MSNIAEDQSKIMVGTRKQTLPLNILVILTLPTLVATEITIVGNSTVERGEPITFTCNATGDPVVMKMVDFLKDGERVPLGSRVTRKDVIKNSHITAEITIDPSRTEDTGLYTCTTSNGLSASMDVQVRVASPSSAVRATASVVFLVISLVLSQWIPNRQWCEDQASLRCLFVV